MVTSSVPSLAADRARLRRRCFADLGVARHKAPERVIVVDDLPRTATGKVRKTDLRARLSARPADGSRAAKGEQ